MPRANPDATPKPAAPSSRASRSAILTPAAEALREPTIGDQRAAQHAGIAAHRQQRRGIVDGLEIGGVVGLAERHEARAESWPLLR